MSAGQYLFGFSGRINRAKWWLLLLIQIGFAFAYYTAAFMLAGTSALSVMTAGSAEGAAAGAGGSILLFVLLSIAYSVLMFVVWLAVTTKRLHDREKSGAWILLFAIGPWLCYGVALVASLDRAGGLGGIFALAGFGIALWAFVELGCLRGTVGPNRFGPDPLPMLVYAPPAPPPQTA